MNAKRTYSVFFLGLLLVVLARVGSAEEAAATSTVVMVCEHGTVKSLIASRLFDQEAAERGLELQAVSRGVSPDATVPQKIAAALKKDGFDVSSFEPRKLSGPDVAKASRVVAIGADLSAFQGDAASTILQWDDVPPASVDYEASKASLLAHIRTLLDDYEARRQ